MRQRFPLLWTCSIWSRRWCKAWFATCCGSVNARQPKSGAHVLLQMRVKTHDGELGAIFKRWYPDMALELVSGYGPGS